MNKIEGNLLAEGLKVGIVVGDLMNLLAQNF